MKTFKYIKITIVIFAFIFVSCEQVYIEEEINSGEIVEGFDLWYVDYHRTQGNDQIPFLSRAFTLSFVGGALYANNNISGIGSAGNGYGIQVGSYSLTHEGVRAKHDIDGIHNFEVFQISQNEIKIYSSYTKTSYFLIGYNTDEFDYDKLFYENIEYLLQDFEIWNKVFTSTTGTVNEFDNENFLKFTSENNRTFYSSNNISGTDIVNVLWNYEGRYEVFDVDGFDDLKVLTLDYDSVNTETFELSDISDSIVELFHIASGTIYKFEGDYFIQYLKDKNQKKKIRSNRKRTMIKRKKVSKISY